MTDTASSSYILLKQRALRQYAYGIIKRCPDAEGAILTEFNEAVGRMCRDGLSEYHVDTVVELSKDEMDDIVKELS